MKENKNINYWIIYYIVLGIIQAMWTNPTTFPPMLLRLGMIFATFFPILIHYELLLFAFPFTLILVGNLSTKYQYLPDINSSFFYILIELLFLIIHKNKIRKNNLLYIIPMIILMAYMGFIDVLYNGELGKYAINIFLVVLFIPFVQTKKDFHLLSASLLSVCCLLAIYYIVMFDQFLITWNASENLERSGWSDPNYFATLLDIGFFISIVYLFDYIKGDFFIFNKYLLTFVCIVIFLAVVMTASRAGFLSYIILLVILLLSTRIKWYGYVMICATALLVFYYMYTEGVFDLLLYRLLEDESIETGGSRITIWNSALANYNCQPFYKQFFGGGYWHRISLGSGEDMHNEFLGILMDYGLIGIILFICYLFTMLSFKTNIFSLRNIALLFYLLMIVSLTPFQYVNVGFLLVWIASLRMPFVRERNI